MYIVQNLFTLYLGSNLSTTESFKHHQEWFLTCSASPPQIISFSHIYVLLGGQDECYEGKLRHNIYQAIFGPVGFLAFCFCYSLYSCYVQWSNWGSFIQEEYVSEAWVVDRFRNGLPTFFL